MFKSDVSVLDVVSLSFFMRLSFLTSCLSVVFTVCLLCSYLVTLS